MSTVILESVLTCPHCGHAQKETMLLHTTRTVVGVAVVANVPSQEVANSR